VLLTAKSVNGSCDDIASGFRRHLKDIRQLQTPWRRQYVRSDAAEMQPRHDHSGTMMRKDWLHASILVAWLKQQVCSEHKSRLAYTWLMIVAKGVATNAPTDHVSPVQRVIRFDQGLAETG
jgi:hypothetical protein